MKHLMYVLFVLFVCAITNAQDLTLIHINAKWNTKNNYKYFDEITGVKLQYGYLEDQSPAIKESIKAVPTIILMRSNRPIYIWSADISLRIKTPLNEIQGIINEIRFPSRRATSTE